jgi:IS605 OrfB family transposase
MLAEWKKEDELSFLNEVSCVPLQQGLRHLQTGFANFWAGRVQAQKALSRKMNGSNNRHEPQLKVANLQAEIADPRNSFLHKLTTQLVRDNQAISIEDLAVKNGLKNRNLAQPISDASWGEWVRQLTSKSEWYGRELLKIDRWFPSSKRCSNCEQDVERLHLNVREWKCPECGHEHDRDVNAAINVLAAGQAVSVWVATVRPEETKSRLCWCYEAETQIVRSGNLGAFRPERMSNWGIDELASYAELPQGARKDRGVLFRIRPTRTGANPK